MKRKFKTINRSKAQVSRPPKSRMIANGARDDSAESVEKSPSECSPTGKDAESLTQDRTDQEADSILSPAYQDATKSAATDDKSEEVNDSESLVGEPNTSAQVVADANTDELVPEVGQEESFEEQIVADPQLSEDALREQYYITFTGEEEGDYTDGPARMILTTDGVKTCAALLITFPLSSKIQSAIKAQREYAHALARVEEQHGIYSRFDYELQCEIKSHKERLSGEEKIDNDLKRRLESEVSTLQRMLDDNQMKQLQVQGDLEYQADGLRGHQESLNADLEEAFVHARLLEAGTGVPETPLEKLDLQKEYKRYVEEENAVDGGSPHTVVQLDTFREQMSPQQEPLTEDQQREEDVKAAVYEAFWRYQSALEAFDNREMDRAAEYQANAEAFERGEAVRDASREAFDLRWVQRIQDLTREVIEAESALSTAKATALDEGVDVPMDDRASGFIDDAADGYRMSMEQAMIGSVPSPKIRNWMSEIPEVASPSFKEQSPEADDWEARDVEFSDSVSMIAQDAGERKRIDKWRRVCGL